MAWFCNRKPKQQKTELETLLDQLSGKDRAARVTAAQRIEAMGGAAIDELKQILEAERERRTKAKRSIKIGAAIYVGVIAIAIGFVVWSEFHGGNIDFPGGLFNVGIYSGLFGAAAASQKQKSAAKALSMFDDPSAVGFLAEALWLDDKELHKEAGAALVRLLPLATGEHAKRLTSEQRKSLYKSFDKDNDDLIQTVLKAMPIVGDGEALAPVERLIAKCKSNPKRETTYREAEKALPVVQAMRELEIAAGTLLRPVDQPMDGANLLRPAQGGDVGDPNLLLRPADKHDDRTALVQPQSESEPSIHVQAG